MFGAKAGRLICFQVAYEAVDQAGNHEKSSGQHAFPGLRMRWHGACKKCDGNPITNPRVAAVVTITENAISAARRFVKASETDATGLRIIISYVCGDALQCGVRLEERAQPNDKVVDCGAVKLFIDPNSVPYIDGATIDFVDERDASGFRFTNLGSKRN
ncbi:MAG: iron-sulfur cluster assembly accessory protein [Gammaproteobacteria bacterium]|nr:iron-sulfur cluster assembly accessory protein [Gammaproteobacteria bacterium]